MSIDVREVNRLHAAAMKYVAEGVIARTASKESLAHALTIRAYEFERRAAMLLVNEFEAEPSRSVLFRSASCLAIECGKRREAEQMAAQGLAGNPPESVAAELRDTMDRATFERHFELKGIRLSPNEFQMSLTGDAIGYGIAESSVVTQRTEALDKILVRTAERIDDQPFREHGVPGKSLKERFGVFQSMPRAASFAITIRLGRPYHNSDLFGIEDDPDDVIDEFFKCLKLVNTGNVRGLSKVFGDRAYYLNFVALCRKLAPDGKRVRSVGFTRQKDSGDTDTTAFTARPVPERRSGNGKKRIETIVGLLRTADMAGRHKNSPIIRIETQDPKPVQILVPLGMMEDIVRPHWDHLVKATISKAIGDDHPELIDLHPVDSALDVAGPDVPE